MHGDQTGRGSPLLAGQRCIFSDDTASTSHCVTRGARTITRKPLALIASCVPDQNAWPSDRCVPSDGMIRSPNATSKSSGKVYEP